MRKKLFIFITTFILFLALSSCGKKMSVTLINIDDNSKEVVEIVEKNKYDITYLPKVIDGHYVKYKLNEHGEYLNQSDSFELKNKKLYYSLGIEEDYFKIESVGTVHIFAKEEINTKENYVNADIVVSDGVNNVEAPAKIKLRGNTTLHVDKKSYKIKFNEKQDLLGMGSDKEWALLANYFDATYIRNYYAYSLAKALGLEYTCDCKFVEVYLNGKYNGLYLLTETVKTSKERVNIEVDTTKDEYPFLLELDMKIIQDNPNYMDTLDDEMFLIDNTEYNNKIYPFGTKYPDSFQDISSNQYQYIKDYMNNVFKSVRNGTYEDYIDIESFINYFLIQELFMNPDLDYSSVYMYKPVGEKLKFGPLWDFDLSSGNAGYVEGYSYDKGMKDINGGSYFFNELYKYDNFKDEFMNRLIEVNLDILPALFDSIDANYKFLSSYAKADDNKWEILDDNNWARPSNLVGISYKKQVKYFEEYLVEHNKWMLENM